MFQKRNPSAGISQKNTRNLFCDMFQNLHTFSKLRLFVSAHAGIPVRADNKDNEDLVYSKSSVILLAREPLKNSHNLTVK